MIVLGSYYKFNYLYKSIVAYVWLFLLILWPKVLYVVPNLMKITEVDVCGKPVLKTQLAAQSAMMTSSQLLSWTLSQFHKCCHLHPIIQDCKLLCADILLYSCSVCLSVNVCVSVSLSVLVRIILYQMPGPIDLTFPGVTRGQFARFEENVARARAQDH